MPQYKLVHPFPNTSFKVGDTLTEDQLAQAGLSANVLAKDGFLEVDGKSQVATTSYAPNNPGAVSPVVASKPANAVQSNG